MAIAGLASALALPARAADCDAVLAALTAQAKVPSAALRTTLQAGAPATHDETVVVGEKMYSSHDGVWSVFDHPTKLVLERMMDDFKTTKATCEKAGSERINGHAAAVYRLHEERPGPASDARVWISESSGLPVKFETIFPDLKISDTFEYRYENVVAPPNAK